MASLFHPHNVPSSSSSAGSNFSSSVNHFQSTPARKQPFVVAMSKRGNRDGVGRTEDIMRGAMMDSDSNRPWWSPIFEMGQRDPADPKVTPSSEEERPRMAYRSRLTEEKARVLRKELRATENWHDAMYHSAIASRLACSDHQ